MTRSCMLRLATRLRNASPKVSECSIRRPTSPSDRIVARRPTRRPKCGHRVRATLNAHSRPRARCGMTLGAIVEQTRVEPRRPDDRIGIKAELAQGRGDLLGHAEVDVYPAGSERVGIAVRRDSAARAAVGRSSGPMGCQQLLPWSAPESIRLRQPGWRRGPPTTGNSQSVRMRPAESWP